MTQAEQVQAALSHKIMTWTELLTTAEHYADAYEQDYDNEITYFEYPDGSVAVFNGMAQDITVYGCRE